jgi:hypothetical protein
MRNTIKSAELEMKDVPLATAQIKKIKQFALTFDWNEQNDQIITENIESDFHELGIITLRSILYNEQRRWNHFGREFDKVTEDRIRNLISVIRDKLDAT